MTAGNDEQPQDAPVGDDNTAPAADTAATPADASASDKPEESAPAAAAADTPPEAAEAEKAPAAEPAPAPAKKAAPVEDEPPPPPEPTPETCFGVVIAQDTFEKAVMDGEFDETDFMFYLEPAGVMNGPLICARAYPAEKRRGGILMTRAAREAKTVFFDDGLNPERYELSFPKEFGYVKSVKHYQPETYEHAKYPFSKKY